MRHRLRILFMQIVRHFLGGLGGVLLSKKAAENEASWFILQWGLTTNPSVSKELLKETKKQKKFK